MLIFRCDKIIELNEPDVLVEADMILKHPFEWERLIEMIERDLADGRLSAAMDNECADV
jgi:hypothetical protein